MKVRELIEILQDFPEDREIVVQLAHGPYAEEISRVKVGFGVRAYWGSDYEALVLKCGSQVGGVWEKDELELDE